MSNIAQNEISPIRIFRKKLNTSSRTCIGHFIYFTSAVLEIIVKKYYIPRVKTVNLNNIYIGGYLERQKI